MEIVAREPALVIRTFSASETEATGKTLGALLGPGDVVGLTGELGAGKTCFVRGVAEGVGVDPSVPVVSPSFTIVNEYDGRLALYHFDFYRLEGLNADFDLEWREYFYGTGVVVIEWAEKVAAFLPDDCLEVTFSCLDDDEREIRFAGQGERPARLIAECGSKIGNIPVR